MSDPNAAASGTFRIGGELSVQSVQGEGSTFTLTLPLAETAAAGAAATEEDGLGAGR